MSDRRGVDLREFNKVLKGIGSELARMKARPEA
jgi:hypothetical protein